MSASTRAADGAAFAAAAVDDRATLPTKNRAALMWAIMAVSICQFLDATIANVALPHMQTSLGASIDTISWVVTSFIMAGAIVTPVTGWLSDRYGSRNLFIWSTALFLVASALCGMATSLTMMVICRSIQGAASALMGPLSQTVLFDINPPSKQAGAISLWGSVSMIAPISGPFIGGFLTEYLNWRWVYYVNLPIGIPAILALWLWLPSRPLVRRRLDQPSYFAIALGLAALQLALDRGQQQGWLDSWEIIIELSTAAACLWMFVTRSIFTSQPLFNPRLYSNISYVAGMVFMTMMGVANVALSATLPTMYQNVYGYSVITSGMLMAPRGISLMISMLIANWLVKRVEPRLLISCGFAILAYALGTLSGWALEMEYTHIVAFGLIQGFGLGLIFTPISLSAFGTLEPELRTDGSSLINLCRNLGASFGVSFIVSNLARMTQVSHEDMAGRITANAVPGFDLGTLVGLGQSQGQAAVAMANMELNHQALMISYLDTFHGMALVLIAFVPVPFLLPRARM